MLENIVDGINWLFMIYIFLYAVIFFLSTVYALINLFDHKERERHDNDLYIRNEKNFIPISVLVPAYNEEVTICDCLASLLDLDYPEYEVIVIDDGSKDLTSQVIIDKYQLKETNRPVRRRLHTQEVESVHSARVGNVFLTLARKKNGGKADALNVGLNTARFPYVVALDADSMLLARDSLKQISMPTMEDDRTIAVGGNIKIANQVVIENGQIKKTFIPKNFVVLMQMVEYARIFITTRVWFNQFNGNLIISGAFGLFKKDVIIDIGGYKNKSLGEDMMIVVNIHSFFRRNKREYRISYVPTAICWTQVPSTMKDLGVQRKRWHKGLMESLIEHRYIFLNPRFGWIGFFSYAYYLFYEMLSPFFEVIGFLTIIISFITGFINVQFLMTFFTVYIFYSVIVSVSAMILDFYMMDNQYKFRYLLTFIGLAIVEAFGYRQYNSILRIIGTFEYFRKGHSWGSISRSEHLKTEKV
ncbi:glycosyltransferase family 2 protein [Acidaminobacter sp. JC074]|uniref:glycosyltransferase family 2 protein n=1 Tax=Acidaminobacter sp. JC074 TaxID=2530199 RepID=UPI001F0EEB6F|nr:glycosyltransferase [Acidaminobacter sp. JC074]MCH4886628.1 glycosyltransferase family 2 protein [Acidaminobacter sp. JC074]